ncbi:hypothetical protein GLOTRDRAFT_110564 [Gloeophyllum trabeum ATCC 11539]|uniref:Uncharacterized protein n=1 Tax=Gloeophyllum trabeum (strain ATCC 11539 / FP-39264 / Madison 617) TaxID=670483 RepID=S7QDF7_GLOTA|nr:uncharacterized protein GLOTRDRAFT_110564 [Gloeophyllum trabeum ATCC 11539]EPQ57423.1 hypothetical protein GLOTRDRAFT_110564 [Gloeophyllum trabeum ATCC 11539]
MQSLARATTAAALARPGPSSTVVLGRRYLAADSHAHHDEHHDNTQYRPEGFTSAGWRYLIVGAAAVVAFYKWAPAPGEEAYLTRYIKYYMTPAESWEAVNTKHLLLSAEAQAGSLLIAGAKRPLVHRYRYPQMLDHGSPHLQPIGTQVDLSNVVVKGDRE